MPPEIVHDDTLLAESLLRSNQKLREEYNELAAKHAEAQREAASFRVLHESIVADLRAGIETQDVEVKRAALWAAHLSLDLHSLKSKVTRFVKGVGLTPWKTTVPRVLGFKEEFDAMVTELAKPEATLPSAEAIRAATSR
jgi:hypothetical protein